jgi:antitoxin component of RelBE/YafQ-DinJ toxin-antitoxin module
MQTTLRINDAIFREAKAKAARMGITLTRFIEVALQRQIEDADTGPGSELVKEIQDRNELMESLLQATAHFRIGPTPTREQMNER